MKTIALRLLPFLLAIAPEICSAADETPPPIEYAKNFVKPKAILQVPPRYPDRAARAGKEGWVVMRYSIETDGSVSEVVIVDSSDYKGVFGDAAVASLKNWRYQTPMLDGKPARKCNNRQMITFVLDPPVGGGAIFAKKDAAIRNHIKNRRFDEAEALIREAHESKGLNLYEIDRLYLQEGALNAARGDDVAAIRAFTRAISGGGGHLSKEEEVLILRSLFTLQIKEQRFAAALDTFGRLNVLDAPTADDPIRQAAVKIEQLRSSTSPFAVEAQIDSNPNAVAQRPFFDYTPLRREIGITDVSGAVTKLSIACDTTTATVDFEPGWSWKAPPSWGECSIFVYGTPGTTFQIVEY